MARLIIGHTTDNSSKIWVRGSERWSCAFVELFNSAGSKVATKSLVLDGADFFTGVHRFTGLKPKTPYKVKVSFAKSLDTSRQERVRDAYTTGAFTTFPVSGKPKFSFLLGSCNLHSLGPFQNPDKAWACLGTIASQNDAQFMMHCGDQIYADIPFGPTASLAHYRNKYLDAWEDCKPAQRLLTELPHYMILDDHEIDNDFDNADFRKSHHIDVAMKVYYEFQHKHNPDTPPLGGQRRYHYNFSYGDVEFFVMDTRYKRDSDSGQMIDGTQLSRLKSWMTRHKNKLKFVVTSVPFVGDVKSAGTDKWCSPAYTAQRFTILEHIVKNDIQKVVFLTGDMHASYHANMQISDGTKQSTIHELMASPINQFTPDTSLTDKFVQNRPVTHKGITAKSELTKSSFYGSHSNAMVISVDGDKVHYSIQRTTKSEAGPKGSFTP